MSTFVSNNVSSGGVIYASDHNEMGSRIAAVVNGGIDSTNISPTAAISGTQLASNTITDTQLATAVSPVTRSTEYSFDFVASGCVWTADAAGSTRVASMTSGVVYINGVRVTVSAVTSRTFTASKDVYVDVDSTGTITYTDNTTNAASPALAANSIRLGIIVVGASSIAAATSINQGQENRVLPIASSVAYTTTDSLGNLICPRDPNRKLIGLRQITTSFNSSSTTTTQVTGLSVPVITPNNGRKVKITVWTSFIDGSTSGAFPVLTLWDGAVGSGTQLGILQPEVGGTARQYPASIIVIQTPLSASKTYNVGFSISTGSGTVYAASTSPAYVSVESY
jgi:hypothetical protein